MADDESGTSGTGFDTSMSCTSRTWDAASGTSRVCWPAQALIGKQRLTRLLRQRHEGLLLNRPFGCVVGRRPRSRFGRDHTAHRAAAAAIRAGRPAATGQVIDAACRADLARSEDPAFHDRLQRTIVNATIRPLQMTTGLMGCGSSALGAVAVGAALLTIEPLFFVLGVAAAVPLTLTSLRVGRALYRSVVEQSPTDRERSYIQVLLVEKDPAKEIRAYQLGAFLRARFAALYERRSRPCASLSGGAPSTVSPGPSPRSYRVASSDHSSCLSPTDACP
jgi:hypothetical protein